MYGAIISWIIIGVGWSVIVFGETQKCGFAGLGIIIIGAVIYFTDILITMKEQYIRAMKRRNLQNSKIVKRRRKKVSKK